MVTCSEKGRGNSTIFDVKSTLFVPTKDKLSGKVERWYQDPIKKHCFRFKWRVNIHIHNIKTCSLAHRKDELELGLNVVELYQTVGTELFNLCISQSISFNEKTQNINQIT